jgi:hypothetical protein
VAGDGAHGGSGNYGVEAKCGQNERTHELPWELRKLAGRSDGGERGRRAPAVCGGVNGAGGSGWRAAGKKAAFIGGLGGSG